MWAHLAEIVPYWLGQLPPVLDAPPGEAPPFGRVKTNPDRIAAIERDRGQPVAVLMGRVSEAVAELRELLRSLTPEQWAKAGSHQTLGVMDIPRIMDEFLVGHLEQHADQLDSLAGRP